LNGLSLLGENGLRRKRWVMSSQLRGCFGKSSLLERKITRGGDGVGGKNSGVFLGLIRRK